MNGIPVGKNVAVNHPDPDDDKAQEAVIDKVREDSKKDVLEVTDHNPDPYSDHKASRTDQIASVENGVQEGRITKISDRKTIRVSKVISLPVGMDFNDGSDVVRDFEDVINDIDEVNEVPSEGGISLIGDDVNSYNVRTV